MQKWKVPDLYEVNNAAEFFKRFISLNSSVKGFSQRQLAKVLKWPVSYLPDVIKGRKPLTVARCLEFIKTFRLNPLDAEQLIFIAVDSQTQGGLQQLKAFRDLRKPLKKMQEFSLDVFSFEVLFIFEVIRWFRGEATEAKIQKLISRKSIAPQAVTQALNVMLEHKLITMSKEGKISNSVDTIFSDKNLGHEAELKLHNAFADNFKRFLTSRMRPAAGSTTFLQLNLKRFEEIEEKLLSLRNWLHEVSLVDSVSSPQSETVLFQFDHYLFAQFDSEDIGRIYSED